MTDRLAPQRLPPLPASSPRWAVCGMIMGVRCGQSKRVPWRVEIRRPAVSRLMLVSLNACCYEPIWRAAKWSMDSQGDDPVDDRRAGVERQCARRAFQIGPARRLLDLLSAVS